MVGQDAGAVKGELARIPRDAPSVNSGFALTASNATAFL